MQIDVELDKVAIEHQIIARPSHVSRSEWLQFWDEKLETQTDTEDLLNGLDSAT